MPPNLTHLLQPLDVCVFQPYKHYHGQALDRLVRDGATDIGKLEFISIIEEVRKKAFKASTIKSAFKKSGIYPLDPSVIISEVISRQAAHTPTPPPYISSSDPTTPTTYRQLNRTASKIEAATTSDPTFSPSKATLLNRFIKGALFSAATGVQLQRDLGRTRYAEAVRARRRSSKNYRLQTGGVLSVSEARNMLVQKKDAELQHACRVLEAREKKQRNKFKRVFNDAAKKAREWRRTYVLPPAEIIETGRGKRMLLRF